MKINHAVELEDGGYTYQGELTGPELKFMVEFAINELLMRGALPFLEEGTEDVLTMPEPEVAQ